MPVVHGRVEFADAARRVFEEVSPTSVVLELPETIGASFEKAVARLPAVTVLTYGTSRGRVYMAVEPADPFAEAARLAMAAGIPIHYADADLDRVPEHADPVPDTYAINRIGCREYVETWLAHARPPKGRTDVLRERAMAAKLRAVSGPGGKVLFLCGLAHLTCVEEAFSGPQAEVLRRVRPRDPVLYHLSPDSLGETLTEIPFVQAVYELYRSGGPFPEPGPVSSMRKRVGFLELLSGKARLDEKEVLDEGVYSAARDMAASGFPFDRLKALFHLVRTAGRHYAEETGERLEAWQRRTLFRYLRNWAHVEGRLLPDFYQLLEGAKAVVDDNFAYAVWRMGVHMPWQGAEAEIPAATITADMLGFGKRVVRMKRRNPRPKTRPLAVGKGRAKGLRPGEWLKGFKGEGICSYPPEDLVVENFGRWLKKKAGLNFGEEHSRTEPFSGSLLDGIDMRETIRNLPKGEIHVKRAVRLKGGMGSVVVVFDGKADLATHPYVMTWLGEHDQESDMAFYATPPLENVVGPGICRVEYGGFLLSYPPLRLYDIWSDPDYYWTRTPAERLLAAAIDYSLEKNVVYCAPEAPGARMKEYASHMGRRIVYVPSGLLGPRVLRKIRVMHVLDGKSVRGTASAYIW